MLLALEREDVAHPPERHPQFFASRALIACAPSGAGKAASWVTDLVSCIHAPVSCLSLPIWCRLLFPVYSVIRAGRTVTLVLGGSRDGAQGLRRRLLGVHVNHHTISPVFHYAISAVSFLGSFIATRLNHNACYASYMSRAAVVRFHKWLPQWA